MAEPTDRKAAVNALVRLLDALPHDVTVVVQSPVCTSTFLIPRPVPPVHSPDFRSVTVGGCEYSFSPTQAAVVQALWEAWAEGAPDVGQAALLEEASSEAGQLRSLFRPNGQLHPAWGVLIVPGRARGTFRLNL